MDMGNLLEKLPDASSAEIFETLIENSHVKIERIVSGGQATAPGQWCDQDWDEWVLLLMGNAGVLFEGDEAPVVLEPGGYLSIPAHRKHRVEWTAMGEKTIWLAINIKGGTRGKAGKAIRTGKEVRRE